MSATARYTIGVDIGGTFTDLTMVDSEGEIRSTKAATTPDDFSRGVLDALAEGASLVEMDLAALVQRTDVIKHGSTVATNALLTRDGARVGLVTTRGFEDTPFIMRAVGRVDGLPAEEVRRVAHVQKPQPLVPRNRVVGIYERIDVRGSVVVPASRSDISAAVRLLVEGAHVEAVAVSLLHSWRNPTHERLVKRVIESQYPGRGLFVTLSSELSQQAGEYARSNTAIANAFVGPYVHRYLRRLDEQLRELGFTGRLLVMQGNGGLAGVDSAAPISTLQSGPAGGMLGAALLSRELQHRAVVTADMGGTSFDVGLISHGVWKYADEPVFARLRMLQPITDIRSIGAGGGTIARVDTETGRLLVGPESAGASPGPACYGAGGAEATVTDCDLMLGYLDPRYYLGGRKPLFAEPAANAIEKNLAVPLGLDVVTAAAGVYDVINSKMSDLIRQEIVRSGMSPGDCVLYAFGGAGGVHAAAWAGELGIATVVVAATSPVFSAHGIAMSDFLRTQLATRSYVAPFDADQLNADLDALESQVAAELAEDGFQGRPQFTRYVTMHFLRQTTGEEMPLPWDRLDEITAGELDQLYVEHYRRLYGAGAAYERSGLGLSRIRVDAIGRIERRPFGYAARRAAAAAEKKGERPAYFGGEFVSTPVYDKAALVAHREIAGPAVIESELTTVVLPPGATAVADEPGNLVMSV